MSIDLAGSSNKAYIDAAHIDMAQVTKSFSVHVKFKYSDTTGAYARIIHMRDGTDGFYFVQNTNRLYVVGSNGSSTGWAPSGNLAATHFHDSRCDQSLVADQWYTATVIFSVVGGKHWFCSAAGTGNGWLSVDGGTSSHWNSASSLGTGDDTDQITFGSRCRTGTTTQSEGDQEIADFAIWEDYEFTDADRRALEGGASPLIIAPHKLKTYLPMRDDNDLVDIISGKLAVDGGSASVSKGTTHPNVNAPVGAQTVNAVGSGGVTPQNISPDSISTGESFGTPSLSPGEVNIAPSSITTDESFGTPSVVSGTFLVRPNGIPTEESFGSPVLSANSVLTPNGIVSAESFGSPVVIQGAAVITLTSINSGEVFGSLTILGGVEPEFDFIEDWLDSLVLGNGHTDKFRLFLQGKGYSGDTTEMVYEYLKTKSTEETHMGRWLKWREGGFG